MKKMFVMLICLLVTVPFLTVHSFAEEVSPAPEPVDAVDASDTTGEVPPSPNLMDRLQEAWDSGDITATVTLLYNVVCTVLLFVLKASSNANAGSVRKKVDELADTSIQKINEVVSGYNTASQEIESVKASLLEFQSKFNQLAEHEDSSVQKMQSQIDINNRSAAALASMLQTIYSNSTTIPQSVKDIVNQKYLEVVRAAQQEDGQSEK